jgi:hypothetical protein
MLHASFMPLLCFVVVKSDHDEGSFVFIIIVRNKKRELRATPRVLVKIDG